MRKNLVEPGRPQLTTRYGAEKMQLSYRISKARTQIKGIGKGKVHPITGHESPEVE